MEQGGVEVQVKSQLSKIIEDLEKITQASATVSSMFKDMSKGVGKEVKDQTKQVEDQLNKTQSFGRRVADQLKKDFQALFAVQSLGAGLKLSEQFSGSIRESITLSDTVRKLGGIFGIAGNEFIHFQNLMQQGLGEIGASSESAANALKGLSETPVRGEKNLLQYAKTAAQLASVSGEKGNEGNIAKGAAGIIQSRGGNVNDLGQLNEVTNEILQIRKATGKSVSEITGALQGIYAHTNTDYQKQLRGGGSTTIATAALQGGPQATAFLEKFMGMNRIERKGLEAQGFKDIIGKNGQLNTEAILSTLETAKGRGLGDAQAGLKTFGFGDDEAKGFIRLAEAVKNSGSVINGAKDSVVNLNDEYRKTMSLGDSFRANINKVKGLFAPLISAGSQGATELMSHTSGNLAGAGAVTATAGILSAVLVGGGLKGIGKGLGGLLGGEAKAQAVEAATGEHVQKVEVVNFPNSFGVGATPSAASIAKYAALGAGGLALGAGVAAAGVVAYQQTRISAEKDPKKQEDIANSGDRASGNQAAAGSAALTQALIDWLNKGKSGDQKVHVKVEAAKKDFRTAVLPGRGSSP